MTVPFELRATRTIKGPLPVDGEMSDITERRPCFFPIVYGYIRLPAQQHGRRVALESALRGYCSEHEMTLGGTFTECGAGQVAVTAPFIDLLRALTMPGTYGVIVPSVSHLGCGQVVNHRQQCIKRIGVRLLIIRHGPVRRRQAMNLLWK
jgi:hypothetical protein